MEVAPNGLAVEFVVEHERSRQKCFIVVCFGGCFFQHFEQGEAYSGVYWIVDLSFEHFFGTLIIAGRNCVIYGGPLIFFQVVGYIGV